MPRFIMSSPTFSSSIHDLIAYAVLIHRCDLCAFASVILPDASLRNPRKCAQHRFRDMTSLFALQNRSAFPPA
ncbi:MAG: hypothetical protein GVY16_04560 [Planctomycetes bacterium]|jgi:hypothetical protein|nr:hypothetical protein [Planctomycetota bacterium]